VPSISVEEVRQMMKSGTPVQIIDTRPKHYTTKAQDIMDGAVWRDPERLDDWIGTLSRPNPSSPSVSTASTSGVRRLRRCARLVLTPAIWRADITPGRQSRARVKLFE